MAYGSAVTGASTYFKRRPGPNFGSRDALASEQGDAYTSAAGNADTANQSFLGSATNFDAKQGLNDYAKGAWASVSQGLDDKLAALKGASVGAGRADSGFFDQDQGTVVKGVMNDFSSNLAQQSLNAQGQQQANTSALASFGQNQQETANDLLMSRREELENNAKEEEAKKAKKRSGIGSAIGGLLGAGLGSVVPGLGTAVGAGLGSSIGGMF